MWVLPQSEAWPAGSSRGPTWKGAVARDPRGRGARALAAGSRWRRRAGAAKWPCWRPPRRSNRTGAEHAAQDAGRAAAATTFLLVSEQPDALLATVRSRCARIQLAPLPENVLVDEMVKRGAPPDEARKRAARADGSLAARIVPDPEEPGAPPRAARVVEAALAAPDEREVLALRKQPASATLRAASRSGASLDPGPPRRPGGRCGRGCRSWPGPPPGCRRRFPRRPCWDRRASAPK